MKIVVFITVPKRAQAQQIAQHIVEKKLAACVNIIDKIDSFFWWQGKIDKAKELLLVIKTKKEKLNSLIKTVRLLHSYSVPEIIALPIIAGNKDYLNWLDESLR
ncbi:MAG: divalent-cation tolerance protein CutA [Candidatus Omnitrophica bacterium]|nr:divalent-cation tolerance protein CutA [Candidatus Omnitrophota bacterium]